MHVSSSPLVKRFKDVKSSRTTVIIEKDLYVHHKFLRRGTVINIVGYREIVGVRFFIISKGSWEGLIEENQVVSCLKKLDEI